MYQLYLVVIVVQVITNKGPPLKSQLQAILKLRPQYPWQLHNMLLAVYPSWGSEAARCLPLNGHPGGSATPSILTGNCHALMI